MFEKVERYYKMGFYSKSQVADFVRKGKLTEEEYEKITGDKYE